MGLLNDIGTRWTEPGPYGDRGKWHVDDVDRPMPKVDVHRKFYFHENPPVTFAEALANRPEIDLVAGAERDKERLQVFGERYGIKALYTDAAEMLRNERPEIVAIPSNTKDRPRLTVLAVENGAKGIMTEKPMAYTLEEADRLVKACADAGVPPSVRGDLDQPPVVRQSQGADYHRGDRRCRLHRSSIGPSVAAPELVVLHRQRSRVGE